MENSGLYPVNNAGRFWGLLAVLVTALTLLSGCDARGDDQQVQMFPPEVDVAQVLAEPVTVTDTFTGRLQAPETVLLRARVSGYIEEVAFAEGELVEAGDLLFQIDPRPYEAQVNAARAELVQTRSQLQLAESEARRAEQLLAGQAISTEENEQRQAALLNAQARVSQAQAALDIAELNLEYTQVVSPVSGRAGRAQVTRGNLARADDTLLTTVVSVNPLHVYFESDETSALSSQYLLAEHGNTTVWIGLSGEDGFPHQGTLDYVDNRMNAGTGTLQYRAVMANPQGVLKPGQFARVRMPVARLEQALLVHRRAVLTDQDRRYVYVVDDENVVSRRQVTTGRQVENNLVVIQEGLETGDRVVVNGTQKVSGAGMQVSPRQVVMRELQPSDDSVIAAAEVR